MAKTEELDSVLQEFEDFAKSFKDDMKEIQRVIHQNNNSFHQVKHSPVAGGKKMRKEGIGSKPVGPPPPHPTVGPPPPPPTRTLESAKTVQDVLKNQKNKVVPRGLHKTQETDSAVEKLDSLLTDMETFSEERFKGKDDFRRVPISRNINIKVEDKMEKDLEDLTMKMMRSMDGLEDEVTEESEDLGNCRKCKRIISSEAVLAGKDTYHQDCFTCAHCAVRLTGKYYMVEEKYYCPNHRTVSLDKCKKCSDFISDGAVVFNNNKYHQTCFKCSVCFMPLDGKFYTTEEGENICELDYKNSRERCHHCSLPMLDQILTAMDNKYHPACFRCALCDKELDGIPFIMDGKAINCRDCYATYKAKQCYICGEGIVSSSERKTSLITCEGRNYHEQCYKCKSCSTPLNGEYCFTRGDNIFCQNCQNKTRV